MVPRKTRFRGNLEICQPETTPSPFRRPILPLPLELLLIILHHLHKNDRPSLAVCLRVSPQFHDIAGPILYQRLTIDFLSTPPHHVFADHSTRKSTKFSQQFQYTRKHKLLQSCESLVIHPHARGLCQQGKGDLSFPSTRTNLNLIRLNHCRLDYRDPASGEDCFHHQGLCRIIHRCRPRHLVIDGVNVYNLNLGLVRSRMTSRTTSEFLGSIECLTVICTSLENNWYSSYRYRDINELPNLRDVTLIIMIEGSDSPEGVRLNLTNFASTTLRRLCQNQGIASIRIINIDKVPCEYWHPTKTVRKPELVEPSDILDKIRDPFLMDLRHTSQIWDEEAWDGSEVEGTRVQQMVVEEGRTLFEKIKLVSAEEYVRTKDGKDVLEPSEMEAWLGGGRR